MPVVSLLLLACVAAAYGLWRPGEVVRDGRHDLGRNGLWLGHAWLGDDAWFVRNGKQDQLTVREPAVMAALAEKLRRHGIRDLYPHLCPATRAGALPAVDHDQVGRFLDHFEGFRVMPWVGGVRGDSARVDDPVWRAGFCRAVAELMDRHPRLAGVQANVEPCPSGNPGLLLLLDELRVALPAGKLLGVAAYPPPTRWQPAMEVHWEEAYFREVAARADQLAVMMYDTGLGWSKPYVRLMRDWTVEVLRWSQGTEVLLGLPAYDDAGTGWHDPKVENLANALAGIHAGLRAYGARPPAGFAGVALYSEWEMDEAEWALFSREFSRSSSSP